MRNENDYGGGSLRYTVIDAPAGTTITFDPAEFSTPQTIVLKRGALVIAQNLTIQGSGAGLLAVDGNAASRIFTVNSGVTASISGMTIQNGTATDGGGIFSNGMLTAEESAFTGNHANSSGGGIYVSAGSLTLLRSTLSSNSAADGGGLYNHAGSSIQVSNSTFYGNTATYGGG